MFKKKTLISWISGYISNLFIIVLRPFCLFLKFGTALLVLRLVGSVDNGSIQNLRENAHEWWLRRSEAPEETQSRENVWPERQPRQPARALEAVSVRPRAVRRRR